jgi:fibronectin type 3 domain-containing protein
VLGHINASGLYTAPSKAGTDTVTAVSNADPTKSDSTVVKVTTAAPPPPTHSVVLSWDASTSTVAGYNVYRSTVSGGGFTKLNLSLITTLTYTDTTVQNGTTYFYAATAVDSRGNESVDSTQASPTIP